MNVDKCESLRVGSKNPNFDHNLGENNIPSNNHCRDLSVFIGKDLYYRKYQPEEITSYANSSEIHLSAKTSISLNSFTKHTYYPNWNMQVLSGHHTTKKTQISQKMYKESLQNFFPAFLTYHIKKGYTDSICKHLKNDAFT